MTADRFGTSLDGSFRAWVDGSKGRDADDTILGALRDQREVVVAIDDDGVLLIGRGTPTMVTGEAVGISGKDLRPATRFEKWLYRRWREIE